MNGHGRVRGAAALAALATVVMALAASALAAAGVTAPTIYSFKPAKVKPVAKVTIAGKNLKGATAVEVDGMKMKFTVVSPTKIVVTLSTKAKTGPITVTTANGKATTAHALKVT